MHETIEDKGKRKCEHCGLLFEPRRRWQRFCSSGCRVAAWHAARAQSQELSELKARLEKLEAKLNEIEREAAPLNQK